jgi:hypothetical protein
VKNGKVLHRVKEERNTLHTIKRRKPYSVGYILHRNSLLKHVIGGNIQGRKEMTGRQGRRSKQLQDDVEKMIRYLKLKEEVLYRALWRTRFGRS